MRTSLQHWLKPGRGRHQMLAICISLIGLNALLMTVLLINARSLPPLQSQLESARDQGREVAELGDQIVRLRQHESESEGARKLNADETLRLLTDSSGDHGITLARMQKDGSNRISVSVDNVEYQSLVAWLITLRQQHGLAIQRINMESGAAAGRVSARLSFETQNSMKPKGIQFSV